MRSLKAPSPESLLGHGRDRQQEGRSDAFPLSDIPSHTAVCPGGSEKPVSNAVRLLSPGLRTFLKVLWGELRPRSSQKGMEEAPSWLVAAACPAVRESGPFASPAFPLQLSPLAQLPGCGMPSSSRLLPLLPTSHLTHKGRSVWS